MLSLLNRYPLQILHREFQAQQQHAETQKREASWILTVDIQETQDSFILFADIPGVGPDDLHIEVEDDVLTLAGKRSLVDEKQTTDLRRERFQGEFSRSFRLSERIGKDGIEAQVKDGVLRLILPKAASAAPRSIAVNFH